MSPNQLLVDAIGYLPTTLRRRLVALRDVVRAVPDPVLVYQMSKVGSSTVQKSLRDAGVGSIHIHFMNPEHHAWAERKWDALPHHFYRARILRPWINATQRQVRVVSLVRDPIARHVSGAFEIAQTRELPVQDASEATRILREELESPSALKYEYEYFDTEISSIFGVDVLDNPFNREKGYGRITRENVDLLILTLERLSDLIPTVLSDFVDAPLRVQRDNSRTDNVYAEVKKRLGLSESRVRRLYDHPWMRHFYTEQDIERFVERWSNASGHE